jgi:undecaprenyl diphosphate synthase
MQNKIASNLLPNHIAIIMDGNRRWGKANQHQADSAHYEGANNLKKIIYECSDLAIKYLTVYAFSTENWNRSKEEVDDLISLFYKFLSQDINEIIDYNIKIKVIGDISKFPADMNQKINNLINQTNNSTGLTLNVALNYGSREELTMAMNLIAEDYKQGKIKEINQKLVKKYLYTKDIPDPDLLIRTSGEHRLSNFLLWQLAYSEFYFSKKLWPDFDKKELHFALRDYASRERRFGAG